MAYFGTIEWFVEVAKGNIPGHSSINKFGHNPSVTTATDPEDVWGGSGIYNYYPTTAQSCVITSDDTNDTSAGTGARTVTVYGLDGDWEEVSETVTMNGTANVNLTEHTYIRLYRAVVVTAGSSKTNEGNITVTGGGNIGIHILPNDGQTQQAIYTIPAAKTGYFIKGYVGVSDGGNAASRESAVFKWKARPNNGVGTDGAWQTKGQMECINDGNNWWQYEYGIPLGGIAEKTDIRIECTEVSATLGVVGGYDLLLVDN